MQLQTLYRSMHDISLECCVVTFGRSCEPLCFYLPTYVAVYPNKTIFLFFFFIKCTYILVVMGRAIVKLN